MYNKERSTPLYDALKKRADDGKARFHMPGHKGKDVFQSSLSGAQYIDFTELCGTGNLYEGISPISDAEKNAALLWHAKDAFYLTGGATQGILTSLFLASCRTGRILLDRGCHRSVYNALALFDLEPTYLQSDLLMPFGIPQAPSVSEIRRILSHNSDIGAVIITSPTYYGVVSDIKEIARTCHEFGALLIVDEAHGAHFPFHENCDSAAALGADLAICSLHKTLPALGQAALLTSNGAFSAKKIRSAGAMFGTSSPSYCIMASMDLAIDFMNREGRRLEKILANKLAYIRSEINSRNIFSALDISPSDPMRLAVCTACGGLCGYDAAKILEKNDSIVCEMADMRNIVFIITAADEMSDLEMLSSALERLEQSAGKAPLLCKLLPPLPEPRLSPHEALLSENTTKKLADCGGMISASSICPYPPGIPTVCGGEIIEAEHISFLLENGFSPDDDISVIL